MSPSTSDLELWRRAATGDPASVDAVMQLADEIVRARCRSFSIDDVEELASRLKEVVMKRLHNKEVDVVRTSLRGWLGSWLCAVRKDLLHDRRKHRLVVLDEHVAGPGPAPIHGAEVGEMRLALDECLGKLPEKHRAAVLARHGQMLSIAASATSLGDCNPTTQRVWTLRGLNSLRDCMKSRGYAVA
ncbi:MAG: hypothetical protein MUC36_17575 [Planctomycetes bacterium]|nr:hypothetical protein [Planctomycetota bacterium]